jgi:hypothetical protein
VAVVALDDSGDYADPVAAMADLATWCGVPDFYNRCLLKIQPGFYTLPAALTTVSGVDVEGSGASVTVLYRAGGSDPTPAVVAGGGGELREVAIISEGGDHALGVLLSGSSRRLRDVYVAAQFASQSMVAVRMTGSGNDVVLEKASLYTFGSAPTARGVEVNGTGTLTLRRADVKPASGNTASCTGIRASQGTLVIEDSIIAVSWCGSGIGVHSRVNLAYRAIRRSRISVGSSANLNLAVAVDVGTTMIVERSELRATTTGGIALLNTQGPGIGAVEVKGSDLVAHAAAISSSGGSKTKVWHSTLIGEPTFPASPVAVDTDAGDVVHIGGSQVDENVVGAGTHVCVASWDRTFDPLPADCVP